MKGADCCRQHSCPTVDGEKPAADQELTGVLRARWTARNPSVATGCKWPESDFRRVYLPGQALLWLSRPSFSALKVTPP